LDPWALSLDDPNVETVIQWKITPQLDISTLYERIRKCATNGKTEGIAVIYVQENFFKPGLEKWLSDTSDWEDAWKKPELFEALGYSPDDSKDWDDGHDDTEFQRARFGLPVTPETLEKVTHHARLFYREAKNIRKIHEIQRLEEIEEVLF
jgi:hypothetical protein